MTKEHLIDTISAQTRQQKAEVEAVIESLTEKIGEALRMGERVDLRGFGSFVVKQRKARQGRNPRTGETISIAAKRDVTFKPGKELSERIKHSQQGLANI
jgi:nucleoid DNA-binding protein